MPLFGHPTVKVLKVSLKLTSTHREGYGDSQVSEYYVGNYPETTKFEDDWSFLQPEIKYFEDTFLKKIEIKFYSTTRSVAERAKLDFLEEILNIILE